MLSMEDTQVITEAVEAAINISVEKAMVHVNDKIDCIDWKLDIHNAKHEEDMKRILPALEAFETSQRLVLDAKMGTRVVGWFLGAIVAIGGAYLTLKQIFWN